MKYWKILTGVLTGLALLAGFYHFSLVLHFAALCRKFAPEKHSFLAFQGSEDGGIRYAATVSFSGKRSLVHSPLARFYIGIKTQGNSIEIPPSLTGKVRRSTWAHTQEWTFQAPNLEPSGYAHPLLDGYTVYRIQVPTPILLDTGSNDLALHLQNIAVSSPGTDIRVMASCGQLAPPEEYLTHAAAFFSAALISGAVFLYLRQKKQPSPEIETGA